jgi:hypothetical protein
LKRKVERKSESFLPLIPMNLSMAVCIWDVDEKIAQEQYAKGRQAIFTFAMLPTEQLCTVFFPVEFLQGTNALSLANNIGKVVADELMICGLKLFNLRDN